MSFFGAKTRNYSNMVWLVYQQRTKNEVLDYVSKSWTGKWPTNRAPSLDSIFIEGQTKHQNVKLLS